MNLQTLQIFREPSTWAGIGLLFQLAGATVEEAHAIGNAVTAIAAALAILLRERK
jgi:hypothetical protein